MNRRASPLDHRAFRAFDQAGSADHVNGTVPVYFPGLFPQSRSTPPGDLTNVSAAVTPVPDLGRLPWQAQGEYQVVAGDAPGPASITARIENP